MKSRGPPSKVDDSIAAHLMRIQDPHTGQPLCDSLLLPQVSVLFWAGFDTTGNTMAWTLYCISQHPQVPPPPPPLSIWLPLQLSLAQAICMLAVWSPAPLEAWM